MNKNKQQGGEILLPTPPKEDTGMRLFEISYTQADGRHITGQLYTADKVSDKLVVLVAEQATDIEVKEAK